MASKAIPADASTLIYLAKSDAFEEAEVCVGPISVPRAVWEEAVEAGERIGAPDVGRIRAAADGGILQRADLDEEAEALASVIAAQHRLGRGESEVIALATRFGAAILDEGRATRAATALGISAVSTLFLPVLGLRAGRFESGQALTLLRRLAPVTGATAAVILKIEEALREEDR